MGSDSWEGIKIVSVLVFTLALGFGTTVRAQEIEKIEIKQGMYEDNVNFKFGEPELVEEIKPGFFPIPRKKALYKIGDEDYMILYFYSKRVNRITILSDVNHDEAASMFADQ